MSEEPLISSLDKLRRYASMCENLPTPPEGYQGVTLTDDEALALLAYIENERTDVDYT